MRPQAEQGGEDNGFNLKGRPEPERPAAAGRTSPRAVWCSGCQMLEGNRTEHTLRGFMSVLEFSD